jgi:hypothetical protein
MEENVDNFEVCRRDLSRNFLTGKPFRDVNVMMLKI